MFDFRYPEQTFYFLNLILKQNTNKCSDRTNVLVFRLVIDSKMNAVF